MDREIDRVVIVAGSAGSLPFAVDLTPRDVVLTGELRHHDMLTIVRRGCSAVLLGHWASERAVLTPLAAKLKERLPALIYTLSAADQEPAAGL